ncbi:hypothetical protein GQF61_07745 [Sphingobacterium sp. DK4209]|uniref:Fimbrillin family protein n=1 Tax=Sphingobacterium zhuxiongii TaxID=2662364 RepID=A0A5Q0QCP6_9SPHI|nr:MULTISPECIES: hypothetical protein [unclassified Sphingobacterium]MVZ65748.1 hypothetical protein [Sphingobacterium sp. DK4209]QGA27947.1 hypothetical protein GFH32_17140 [Sphingobacterium sp. dk4302]
MKSVLMKNLANKVASALILAMVSQFVASCNKSKDIEKVETNDKLQLSVSISGIQENLDNSGDKKAALKSESKPLVRSYEEFDAVVSVDNHLEQSSSIRIQGTNLKSNSGAARAEAIGPGVKYRLFLYKEDGTFVSSNALTANSTGKVAIVAGQNYKWYALSYNNTDDVPDVTSGSSAIALAGGKDVLHAAGTLSVPLNATGALPLGIVFKHKTSRLAIELNSMGMFGNMNSATVAVTGLAVKSGTIDIFTGQYSNLQNHTQTINWASFSNVETGFNDRKVAYAYTVDSTTANSVSVSVASLQLAHAADGVAGETAVTRTFSATPVNFSAVSVTPQIGKTHRILYNLVESALSTVTNSNSGQPVRWSRSNLYFAAGTRNPYRFYATNAQRSDAKSYFAYGALTPGQFVNAASRQDPCAQVYPQGVWRQPTADDLYSISNGQGLLSTLLSSVGQLLGARDETQESTPGDGSATGKYAQYNTTSVANSAFDARSNNLRFYYNGQLPRLGVLPNGFLDLDLSAIANLLGGSYGSQSAIWASNAPASILGLVNLGVWGHLASTEQQEVLGFPTGTPFVRAKRTGELLVSAVGIDVLTSTLKNVRCVRN